MSSTSEAPRESVRPADDVAAAPAAGLLLVAWLVPGAGHLWIGQPQKALTFGVVLTAMFVIGCAFGGRLFPFQTDEWLVMLAALAQWGMLLPRLIAGMAGFGAGEVTSITYEYGNTFLMAAGLLNVLVALNAYDRARGRR